MGDQIIDTSSDYVDHRNKQKFGNGTDYTEILADGTQRLVGGAITWEDIIQPLVARNVDTSTGKLDYDYPNKAIKIADSTSIGTDSHKIHFAYQIEHRFKLDGVAHPHIHWLQSSSDVPNWWFRWRFSQNGKAVGDWTSGKLTTQIFTYTSGTILQLSTASIEIDFTDADGSKLCVSDFIDIEITRDTDNTSTLFTGNDPLDGNALLKAFDMHLQVDSMGSNTEYIK